MGGDNSKYKKSVRTGAPTPPYQYGTIAGLFHEYGAKMAGKYFADPRGTRVYFFDHNFPKLIQLQLKCLLKAGDRKVKASKVIEEIQAGTFQEESHSIDFSRSSTLLWIPEIIKDPDSIHENAHKKIDGDIVYVKKYLKAGSTHKLVFTWPDWKTKKRIVTTSFWVPEDRLKRFLSFPPIWKKEKAAFEGGLS